MIDQMSIVPGTLYVNCPFYYELVIAVNSYYDELYGRYREECTILTDDGKIFTSRLTWRYRCLMQP